MSTLGNILWFILGGLLVSIIYVLGGLVLCITIVGIPFGVQLFKMASFALHPFGKEVVSKPGEPGCLSIVMNVIWVLVGAWEIALIHLFFGVICMITIVGIPFGLQHFKMALLAVFPFGRDFVPSK